ncbi:hypothetical protein [Parafrankia elaeagni]|uniref:hypothetical protein n=1 Tax=Parafrankia elaeagni TaxID=222534 RepID=UPI0003664CD1|nr:hypothetical protein [Parafrankia elaeagni]
MRQRYDDFADWYDAYATRGMGLPFARAADRLLAGLLGAGHGRLCALTSAAAAAAVRTPPR